LVWHFERKQEKHISSAACGPKEEKRETTGKSFPVTPLQLGEEKVER